MHYEIHSIKHGVVTYLMNVLTFAFASVTFIETADVLLKSISVVLAGFVLYFTVKRLRRDLKLRDTEIRIKELQERQEDQKLYVLMHQSKIIQNGTMAKNTEQDIK